MSLSNSDLGFLLGDPATPQEAPAPRQVASTSAAPPTPETDVASAVGERIVPLSERVREAGKRAGIDTDKLGIDISEYDYITGAPDITIGPPPDNFGDVLSGGSTTAATITPGGAFPKQESFHPTKNNFIDGVLEFGIDLGKGLVSDVLDGVSGYIDAFPTAFEQGMVSDEIGAISKALELNPNDLAARAKLKGLREKADALEKHQLDNFWDVGTTAAVFAPFSGPVKLGAKGLQMFGMEAAANVVAESLAKRGIAGTAVRFADRAGRGAAMGGTYGFFSTQGDIEAAKKSGAMMGTLFGIGPAVAAPLKGVFGAAGKQAGRVVNMFNQIPAVAGVRESIYNGPIGRTWDFVATRAEKVFQDHGLDPLMTNMHVARIEGVRTAGTWVNGMKKNLDAYGPEVHEQVSALLERRLTPTQLIAQLGQEKAAPIIRAAADESRRLKTVGRLLQAWGVPMHNSATGELYNFVMRKNFMPHIIVNPEKLLTDPALRKQSIAAIAKRTGKSLQEAEADFLQWAERAKFDAANEASSGTIGRATMEARLYGLPGYSMDLPNVLNLYYQKAGRLLAFHRRFGPHAPDVNVWGGGDDAAAIADAPKPWDPPGSGGGQMELFPSPNTPPGELASGMPVVVAGAKGPMNATVVNPAAGEGKVRVRVGTGKGSKLYTVSGSKVARAPEKAVQKAESLKGLKKGSDATLNGQPVKVKQTTKAKVIVEKANGKTVEVPKDSPNLAKAEVRTTLPKMAAAAVKLEDGTIETGAFHGEIYDRIGDRVGENPVDGFVDAAGKFYTRKQAALGDLPLSEMRQELKRLGYSPKEIGAIVKGMKEGGTLPEPAPEPQAPPDPTSYVPPPPRRVARAQSEVGTVNAGEAKILASLSPDMQRDVTAAMYRGKTLKEALVEARKGVRAGKAPKEVVGKAYQKPTNEKPFRKEAVAKNEGQDLTSNPKLRGVGLTDAEEKVLKRMMDAGMAKQDALDIMFKSGKRKAAQARPTTRNTVKREIKRRKAG